MKYTFGLIGAGNMGGAIALAASRATQKGALADANTAMAEEKAQGMGFVTATPQEVAQESQYLFLGVKPHLVEGLLEELRPTLAARLEKPVVVSMAAGVTTAQLTRFLGGEYPVIRIMPNTPVSLGQGVILYCDNGQVSPPQMEGFLTLMDKAGSLCPLAESLIDMGTAVSGCGPAFVYMVIDAMAEGGVACGLSRRDAERFAAQTLMGAAQMVLETGKHPAQLKNEVCSPGGSTIQGVRLLEQRGVPAAFMDAVIAAYEKSAALGN